MKSSIERIAIIGAGRLGSAFIKALAGLAQFRVDVIIDKDRKRAEILKKNFSASIISDNIFDLKSVDVIIITVPDDAIQLISNELIQLSKKKKVADFVFHTSGAQTCQVLRGLEEFEIEAGSMHPVQTFSGQERDERKLSQIYFGLEGSAKSVEKMIQIVTALQSKYAIISEADKTSWHLACTMASNYIVALLKPVLDILAKIGFNEEQSGEIIYPLVFNSLENIKKRGLHEALTGPIARGDFGTIEKHIQVLSQDFTEYRELYQELGKIALDIGSNHNLLSAETHEKIRQLLNDKDEDDD